VFELTTLLPEILKYGSMGLFCAYLLYALSESKKEIARANENLAAANAARLDDLKAGASEMRTALATATEVIRSGQSIQSQAGLSAAAIAKAVESFQDAIERVETRVNEVANKIASLRGSS
jgi:methyl-accepting chemotaxis protein